MKHLILLILLVVPLAGCASYHGSADEAYTTGTDGAESPPEPATSPSFRPGMNPRDPRDPHFVTPFKNPTTQVEPPPTTTF